MRPEPGVLAVTLVTGRVPSLSRPVPGTISDLNRGSTCSIVWGNPVFDDGLILQDFSCLLLRFFGSS